MNQRELQRDLIAEALYERARVLANNYQYFHKLVNGKTWRDLIRSDEEPFIVAYWRDLGEAAVRAIARTSP